MFGKSSANRQSGGSRDNQNGTCPESKVTCGSIFACIVLVSRALHSDSAFEWSSGRWEDNFGPYPCSTSRIPSDGDQCKVRSYRLHSCLVVHEIYIAQ